MPYARQKGCGRSFHAPLSRRLPRRSVFCFVPPPASQNALPTRPARAGRPLSGWSTPEPRPGTSPSRQRHRQSSSAWRASSGPGGCSHSPTGGRARPTTLLDGRVDPLLADEGLRDPPSRARRPAALNDLARASNTGLRPALRLGPLLVLPSATFFDWIHRAVQFEFSDPVSFAVLENERMRTFPALEGWSAADCAQPGGCAHAFWLRSLPLDRSTGSRDRARPPAGRGSGGSVQQSLNRGSPSSR